MLNCPAYTMDCGSLISVVTTILWCYIHFAHFCFVSLPPPKSKTRIHLAHSTKEDPCTQLLSPLSFSWPRKLQNRAFVKALEDDRQFLESQIKQAKRCAPKGRAVGDSEIRLPLTSWGQDSWNLPLFTGLTKISKRWLGMGFLKHQQDGLHLGMFFFPREWLSEWLWTCTMCNGMCVFLEPEVCLYIYIYMNLFFIL